MNKFFFINLYLTLFFATYPFTNMVIFALKGEYKYLVTATVTGFINLLLLIFINRQELFDNTEETEEK